MELSIYNSDTGKKQKSIEVEEKVFSVPYRESLVHQVTVAFINNARVSTKGHKNRSEVSGGGSKPYRQKGTGRSRAGTIRSPIRVGGGKTFISEANYQQKVNKKMYRSAMRSILSMLVRDDRLRVVSNFEINEPKTKAFVKKMQSLKLDDVLVVTDNMDENLVLASSNLYHGSVCESSELNPVSLIGFGAVVITVEALKKVEEWLNESK